MGNGWHGKSVLVLGLGDTGLSALRWLSRRGARLRAADTREAPPALGKVREEHPHVEVVLGPFEQALLEGVDTVLASPGVALREPVLQAALCRGIEVLGDVEVFARELAHAAPGARVIGITGTNGKSTVTALVAAMGAQAGWRSRAVGNIGVPVLDLLDDPGFGETELLAIELSSYQLETTSSLALDAATMLNLSQDHMDRYDSMADYAHAKERIFARAGRRVVNRDDSWSRAMADGASLSFGLGEPRGDREWGLDAAQRVLRWGDYDLVAVEDMSMKGLHNAANGLAAHALATAVGASPEALAKALREFKGLPHRVELVAQARGVRFFDDSKGTNVGASVAALDGFQSPVVLIAGGDGKGQDFSPLAAAVKARARAVVLLGRDGPAIGAALAATDVPQLRVSTMEEAVEAAFACAHEGDAVLLSPACASFDMFRNYGHRGEVFAAAARALASRGEGH
ncbi:MAG TPA: UDP-N-acetylmuramoyl-L-alanine--D-glutamate ligase [Usitatibacter sp.]|nr:UDP-N-acetylmuramoyl-L-alanine--D-glutamate ligase [Usitatibacter sp.]